jgi:Arc/MetJ family transcription regulator
MKTTIEIADSLLEEAKRIAGSERITLRTLVEEGLRKAVEERRRRPSGFRLRKASYKGKGMQAGVSEGDWEAIADAIYAGRGA